MPIEESVKERITDHIAFLYGEDRAPRIFERLLSMLEDFQKRNPGIARRAFGARWSEEDAFLITYGNQVQEPDKPPLQSLGEFLEEYAGGILSGVHILPFFPYSSDDGFSVIDYKQVNPDWGSWQDIRRIGRSFRLMFDAVINHVSSKSKWFQEFLRGNPEYEDFFITVEEGTDLSSVVRPRATPLLTPFETAKGRKLVWTTFSADQIDLNYANPEVLLRVIDILLFYVEKGAEVIRLDAIAYLWKKIGTPCIHLEETHRVVKLFRAIFDAVAPYVIILTETNVPHEENISYFGNGHDEAQMVYQFSLPPLVLHSIHTGNAEKLSRWASGLSLPSRETTFFNFLASHDGIGMMPAIGILSSDEIQDLVEKTLRNGGFVSYKANPDGSKSVYELNISYIDALAEPGDDQDVLVGKFMASQAIMLSLQGIPGIYVHSLFGSRSDREAVLRTGINRAINRARFVRSELERELADENSLRHKVYTAYKRLLSIRRSHPAFHPDSEQRILNLDPAVFAVLRTHTPGAQGSVLAVQNVSGNRVIARVDLKEIRWTGVESAVDLISGARIPAGAGLLALQLEPYQSMWITGGR